MIDQFNMSYIELAKNADVLAKTEVKKIQNGSIIDWVNETHELTNDVYTSVKEGENLRYRYSYDHLIQYASNCKLLVLDWLRF